MNIFTRKHRLSIAVLCIVGLLSAEAAFAAEQDATFTLRPHCAQIEGDDDDSWLFGPIPSPGTVAETRGGEGSVRCSLFEVLDPLTLKTGALRKGDILDIDVVIDNPSKQPISRVRAWLSYDPNLLEGESIEIHKAFPVVTPNEKDFSPSEGYAKMEASTGNNTITDARIVFARIQLRVKETNAFGTPINFHDVQPSGHTVIMVKEAENESTIIKEEPGVLLVTFATGDANPEPEPTTPTSTSDPDSIDNIFDTMPTTPQTTQEAQPEADPVPEPIAQTEELEEDPNACVRDEDCGGGICTAGTCEEKPALLPNGANCFTDTDCESGLCGSGVCIPNISETEDTASTDDRTAFSLLQIRNLRVTTDGTSAFLAWDPLVASQLKGYSVYFSKTSGRYNHRRTIDEIDNSLTIRSLTEGKRYYFAVRALSDNNEESAFSREVSIVIGDPDSSSAPLLAGTINSGPGRNPVASFTDTNSSQAVPGETGLPSALALFLVGSAVIGTSFASRRQFAVSDTKPS